MAPSALEHGLETDQRIFYERALYISLFADNGVAHDGMADPSTGAYRDVRTNDRVAHLSQRVNMDRWYDDGIGAMGGQGRVL